MTHTLNTRPPSRLAIPVTSADALARAAHLDRTADLLLFQGQRRQAERLADLAHTTRERAREMRA